MSSFQYDREIPGKTSAEVRALTVDPAFLEHWSKLQDPRDFDVRVDENGARLRWLMSTEEWPSIARRALGESATFLIPITWAPSAGGRFAGRLDADIASGVDAKVRAATALVPVGSGVSAKLTVTGTVEIRAGLASGAFESSVRKFVLVPLLDELCDELQKWDVAEGNAQ